MAWSWNFLIGKKIFVFSEFKCILLAGQNNAYVLQTYQAVGGDLHAWLAYPWQMERLG